MPLNYEITVMRIKDTVLLSLAVPYALPRP